MIEFEDLPLRETISPRTGYARENGTRNADHLRRNDNDHGELLRTSWRSCSAPKHSVKLRTLRTHRIGR